MRLRLTANNRWNLVYLDTKPALRRKFKTGSFSEGQKALDLVMKVANEMDHHPHSVTIDGNSIEFVLMTHDQKESLTKDRKLSDAIDKIFNLLPPLSKI